MTINECIDMVDRQKPNAYEIQDKIHWLDQLDHVAWREVFSTHEADGQTPPPRPDPEEAQSWQALDMTPPPPPPPRPPEPFEGYKWKDVTDLQDGDTVLLIPDEFSQVYVDWMFAMIDYTNQEMSRYTNSMIMFNAHYADFANVWNRTHRPIGTFVKGAGGRIIR